MVSLLPLGVYSAKIESIRIPRRGDRATVTMRVEPSGEKIVEIIRFVPLSRNSRFYLNWQRSALQQHREWLEDWHRRGISNGRRKNARAFLTFFLFFPEMGEARVLLDARFEREKDLVELIETFDPYEEI
jgi:hypothetical protein